MLLRELKTNVYRQEKYHKQRNRFCPPPALTPQHSSAGVDEATNTSTAEKKSGEQNCDLHVEWNDTLVIIPELSLVLPKDHEDGFVISSMREPCDQYVSLWSFGSSGLGYMHHEFLRKYPNWTMQAYGQDPPAFDSPRDIHAFRNIWLKDDKVRGEMTRRFYQSFVGSWMTFKQLSTHV